MMQEPPPGGFLVSEEPNEATSRLQKLLELAQSENIAENLSDDKLNEIGNRCVQEYQADRETRSQWEKDCEEGIKLAKQITEDKSWPWPHAANVKFPLLSEAAITFSARAYPEFVQANIVKAEVTGNDQTGAKAARADRISKFQNWQLRYKMPYWESETDSLLVMLPLVGNVFRKVFKDPINGPQARLVRALDFVVNHNAKSLESCRRETEVMEFWGNELESKFRAGEWKRVELSPDQKDGTPEQDKPYLFLEQHRWLDLDEDGYEEPYVVTVHEASGKVVRIVARFTADAVVLNQQNEVVSIEPERHYIKYGFIPNPDGGLYDVGFCHLLLPVSESINTVLNQLLDAGTLSNTQGGLIAKGIRIKGGNMMVAPGEWKFVDSTGQKLSEAIFPLPVREPSTVLFQLLGLLIDSGRALANLKDVLQGDLPTANVPATTVLAVIEQGQKVFSGIYLRIYRAMGAEFKAIFKLNAEAAKDPAFLQTYAQVLDDPEARPDDFNSVDYDVCPVADPTASSQVQRLARAQVLMPLRGTPGIVDAEVVTEYLSAAGYSNVERFYKPKEAQAAMVRQQVMQERVLESQVVRDAAMAVAKMHETVAKTTNLYADAVKKIADAEAAEAGVQIDAYAATVGQIDQQTRARSAQAGGQSGPSGNPSQPGGMAGVAG